MFSASLRKGLPHLHNLALQTFLFFLTFVFPAIFVFPDICF